MAFKKGGFSKPVDIKGKEIKGSIKTWKTANPRSLYFDSKYEWRCFVLLKEAKFDFVFHPESREVSPGFDCWALNKGKTGARKLFKSKVRPISYTTDFAINCNDGTIIFVEAKGFFHKDARLRYKLFQASLKKGEMSLLAYDHGNNMKDMKAIIDIVNDDFGGSGGESSGNKKVSPITSL
jgi:hypothetical protein